MKKRRLNLIIGKKQIIIVGLTLILGVAVYVNYLVGANITEDAPVVSDGNVQDAGNYGDQRFVSANGGTDSSVGDTRAVSVNSADEYFAQARLDKAESRAEAIEVLQMIYGGGDSTETELAVMAQNAEMMSSYIESESKIENVLRAQGFEDVLCYLSENGASVIVKTNGLDSAQAAQIKNALLSEVNIPAEKISILEIK
ncbi:MAG: SpoIIIAH-like family protein [Ruminococcaceae bacterium]|nr:SpoIIIAH-like family protein [Oscillospiraceae bacterium]MBD5117243.1 SpoIIIAH-like family protein [Oscillospiraceae bacterium]